LGLYDSLGPIIELNLVATLPTVAGDSSQLRQVIHNLIQNAQDAASEVSAPRIMIETRLLEQAIELSVTDNGAGFQGQMMPRIFEPYVTTKLKGTGLGLAIVKKIIEEHRGSIQIVNIPSGGARVSVLLPWAHEPNETQATKLV